MNIPIFISISCVTIGSLFSVISAEESVKKPNIVFILADDLGYGDLSSYGQRYTHTPFIDKLTAEGMKFTQHYSGSPVCAPSRCVLMTGKHPGHASVRNNKEIGDWNSFKGQLPLPASEKTIASHLKMAGYATGAFGKWGLGATGSSGDPLKHGFDHFFGFNDQRHAHNYYPQFLNDDDGKLVLLGNKNVVTEKSVTLDAFVDLNDPDSYESFQGSQYAPDLCTERALEFIKTNKEKPFFIYYPSCVPHLALQVPEDTLQEYKGRLDDTPYSGDKGYLPHRFPRAAYAAMIGRMDRDIGKMIALIRELGLEENTIFVFTSDNGASFPIGGTDPEFFTSNGDLRGYKGSVYEGGIRVPLIVSWKGKIAAGEVSDRITGFEDWLPTLLELTTGNTEFPDDIDGISFAKTLLGKQQPEREFLYREFHGYGGQQSIRVGKWKFIRRNLLTEKNNAQSNPELYDLEADPIEKNNLADAYPEIVKMLSELANKQHTPSKDFPIPSLD